MTKEQLINAHVQRSRLKKFSIQFLCDLYETTPDVVKNTFDLMQKHRQVYRIHVHDFYVEVEK